MKNMIERGLGMVARVGANVAGETILYHRDNAVVELRAVPRQPEFLVEETAGGVARVSHEDLDWSIAANQLVLNGVRTTPERGDTIERIEHGNETFEVLPRERDECWRWGDAQRTQIRIHTKRAK